LMGSEISLSLYQYLSTLKLPSTQPIWCL
jgi:hypothetical protein